VWTITPTAQQVIGTSHSIAVRATATTAALGIVSNIPVAGGSVTADATSQVRRTATVTISDPTTYFPSNPLSILSPLGSELLVEYGIVIPGYGTEWIPLITGVIQDGTRVLPNGDLTISLADRSSHVAEDIFTSPTQIGGGSTTYVQALVGLITHMYPSVVVLDSTANVTVCPTLEVNKDRWSDGVEQITLAVAAEAFFDQIGRLVVRPQPTLSGSIVWQVKAGVGGVLISRTDKASRELVYNQVVASGMRTDGTSPVYAIAQDTDPTSPTVYGGSFGARTRTYSSALLTTQAQATAAAAALLEQCRGYQADVTLTTVANPALEPGDVLKLPSATGSALYIVDKVTTGLDPGTAQQISCRSKTLPPESSS
jgi:hypothetical protein